MHYNLRLLLVIIYTSQNIKPLHRAVGSLMSPTMEIVMFQETTEVTLLMIYEMNHI